MSNSLEAESHNYPTTENGEDSGVLEKIIAATESIALHLDVNALSGSNSLVRRSVTLDFAAAPDFFLPILVFNGSSRALGPGRIRWHCPECKRTVKNLFLHPRPAREKN